MHKGNTDTHTHRNTLQKMYGLTEERQYL